ncbi:hypothetical protein, partial [Plantactinospora sp. CA-290183]|uniref:hypothetical protein n=1 Tax=Plantactinospora sp. CA-290183 TaxID=3240006 RepID=UPI003D92DD64
MPELRATLEGLPAGRPRPVVVLSGPSAEGNRYRKVLGPVAHVVDDGYIKSGQGVVRTFKVHSFPTMLALGGGVVRRAGTTLAELALERT